MPDAVTWPDLTLPPINLYNAPAAHAARRSHTHTTGTVMDITAVSNNVIFQFVETSLYGRFVNEAKSGLLISSEDTSQTTYPRWGKVTHVGPDARDVKPGDYALIEAGKWTTGFTVEGERFWKTDDTVIILVSDSPGTTY